MITFVFKAAWCKIPCLHRLALLDNVLYKTRMKPCQTTILASCESQNILSKHFNLLVLWPVTSLKFCFSFKILSSDKSNAKYDRGFYKKKQAFTSQWYCSIQVSITNCTTLDIYVRLFIYVKICYFRCIRHFAVLLVNWKTSSHLIWVWKVKQLTLDWLEDCSQKLGMCLGGGMGRGVGSYFVCLSLRQSLV